MHMFDRFSFADPSEGASAWWMEFEMLYEEIGWIFLSLFLFTCTGTWSIVPLSCLDVATILFLLISLVSWKLQVLFALHTGWVLVRHMGDSSGCRTNGVLKDLDMGALTAGQISILAAMRHQSRVTRSVASYQRYGFIDEGYALGYIRIH